MKDFDWNDEKNIELQKSRNISFEEVVFHIGNNDLVDVAIHPNQEKYPNQTRLQLAKTHTP